MARVWLKILVFVLALLIFALITMPARVVIKEQTYRAGGEQVQFFDVSGRLLKGTARWRWRELSGVVRWSLQRRVLAPVIKVAVRGSDIELEGIVAAPLQRKLSATAVKINANVGAFSEALSLSAGGAEGALLGEFERITVSEDGGLDAAGELNYSGGRIHWATGSATVGALQLVATNEAPELTKIVLQAPSGSQRYMEGSVEKRMFEWRVYRRWVQLLGMSQGGEADDVVFSISDQW